MGDSAADQHGNAAVYKDLSSSLAGIFEVKIVIVYSCAPGSVVTAADAIEASVQSFLKFTHPTYVAIPYELWPQDGSWQKQGFEGKGWYRPLYRLRKALYGHPDSGAHWEKHRAEAIKVIGGKTIPGHPSSFWFAAERQLLTAYVDRRLARVKASCHAALCLE